MNIETLLEFFPQVEPPVTLNEENAEIFRAENKPIALSVIDGIISNWEPGEDEYTEYIPCFRLPKTDDYYGIVYWKIGLLKYEYILVTFDKDGSLISRKSISSVITEGQIIKKSIARIDEDFIIHIAAGAHVDGEEYDPSVTQSYSMEILSSGDILFYDDGA